MAGELKMDVREKLVEQLRWWSAECDRTNFGCQARKLLVEAADYIAHGVTVQECGHWIEKPSGAYGRWQSWCSSCGKHSGIGGIESNRHKPYCPNCGAKMMPQPQKGE